jgi:hypothetical protein
MEWMETMDEAWTRRDKSYNLIQYTNELMLGIPVLPKIKDPEFRKLIKHYNLLRDSIGEAVKENQQDLFLILANVDKMTQALPPREDILWTEARKHVTPQDLGAAFADFVGTTGNGPLFRCRGYPSSPPRRT